MKKPKAHRIISKTDMLFDDAVKMFVWAVKTNPRMICLVRRQNKFIGKYSSAEISKALISQIPKFLAGPMDVARSLLLACLKVDRNFVTYFNRFQKSCGCKSLINPKTKTFNFDETAEQVRAEIQAAVDREVGKSGSR